MSGPDLVFTTATQASAAGGAIQYAFVSCFGAKAVTFLVRTAAGIPTLTSSTIDIDQGPFGALITGIATETNLVDYMVGNNGTVMVIPGNTGSLFSKTDLRFPYDRIALRGLLAASATGVSCWAVTQWD
jgi:hypothetical protein